MEILKYIILGLIQGLTEFLPVSSSGHMVLTSEILKIMDQDASLEIFLHMATLLSVVIYFWPSFKEWIISTIKYALLFFKFAFVSSSITNEEKEKLYWPYYTFYIILASIPAAFVGIAYKDEIEAFFLDPLLTLVFLGFTGIILIVSTFAPNSNSKITWWRATLIGIAQAIAILPGVSRSGSTIVTGMFLGINRTVIAKFSFFMSIPVIFGAFLLKLKDIFALTLNSELMMAYGLAFFSAFISGYYAIYLVMKFIEQGKFKFFGYYCLLVSIVGLIYLSV